MYLNDERFGDVIRRTYSGSGECPSGAVYETVNDGWLIVNAGYFENLLNGCVSSIISSDYVKAQFRQEIIEEYLEEQRQAKKHRGSNLAQVNKKRKAEGAFRKKEVIAMVLQGFTKDEIMEMTGYSKSTVNKALQGLDSLEVAVLYNSYRNSTFTDVPPENLNAFTRAGCNYKAFRKWLSGRGK